MGPKRFVVVCLALCVVLTGTSRNAFAAEWFVAVGGGGSGTDAAPFGRIQDALNVAQPGDTITVGPGTFNESLRTVRNGTATAPILLRAQGERGTTTVTFAGRVFTFSHSYHFVERLVLDGQYGLADTVVVGSAAHFTTLKNVEVRRSTLDLIDIRAPQGVLIEDCLVHHALNAANGRTDAHGIVAGSARDLTIRNAEIHTFSGDGFQIDPGRSAPGWDRVTIEGSRIWLAPLPSAENGFAAGTVPGENAVDTKAAATLPRANIVIRDTIAWGFRGGLIGNMAAFNLKENVNANVDRVTVYNSEIAFRLRGPGTESPGAWVTLKNAVVYDSVKAFRYENDIQNLKIWNTTIGRNVPTSFEDASSGSGGVEVRNLLVLGTSLPAEAVHQSNRATGPEAFADVSTHNYALVRGATAIDSGTTLSDVIHDRAGTPRPQGAGYDVGAYEWIPVTRIGDVVVHPGKSALVFGDWHVVSDSTAASGVRVWHPDAGVRVKNIQSYPAHYFEVTAWVEAETPYRLWIRGKADANSELNDSVYVQFGGSVDSAGNPIYRSGTKSAAKVVLKECSECLLSDWGWQGHRTRLNVLGDVVRFNKTGPQVIRVQTWEDGMSIDQIVLSPSTYMAAPPGPAHDDSTILPES